MKHLLSVSALGALAACSAFLGKGPHVPGAYQGTTDITVVNAGDADVCVFSLSQDHGPDDNWLGEKGKLQNLGPGARRTFAVKPGIYHVLGGFCSGGQVLGAVGTYGAATQSIDGPTLIALGPKPVDAIPGAKTLAFSKFYNTPQASGGGEAAPEPAESATEPEKRNCVPEGGHTDNSSKCCGPMSSGSAPNITCG